MVSNKRLPARRVSDEAIITRNVRRTALSLAIAAALPGAVFMPAAVYAQDDDSGAIEEIVTYGKFRQALVDSIATKRNSTSIVEAISAEDIGKLPDSSIAESLARLPGLAGERVNGRTSGISVRGFKEDYTAVTMNGRELLGIGDNRGVEYDLYPSEIISGVVVYKTPDASMVHQGIAGIVDLRTVRPLDSDPYLVVNANYEQNNLKSANPDYKDNGYRAAVSYSDVFADDTIGFALAVATTESPSQEEQFRGWGYADLNLANATAGPGITLAGGEKVLGGQDSFVRSAVLNRDTVSGVFQYAPSDDLTVTLDALYIDFSEEKAFRGIEEGGPEWGGTAYTVTGLEDGLVTSGYYEGFLSVVRNDGERKDGKLKTFGLNVEYDASDDWKLTFDGAFSKSDKTVTNIESYSGVGRSGLTTTTPATPRSWVMTPTGAVYTAHPTLPPVDLSDFNTVKLAGPQAWGGGMQNVPEFADTTAADGSTIGPFQAQDGFVNEPVFDEKLTTLKLQAERPLEWGMLNNVQFGLYYSDRSKSKDNHGYYLTAPTWPNDGPIPEEYRLGTTNVNFIGLGDIVAYDGLKMYYNGYYTASDAGMLQPDRLGDTYTIDETLTTGFVKFDFETQMGKVPVSGNIGVQIVNADQTGYGFNAYIDDTGFVSNEPIKDGDSYTDVLPSLNLNFEVTDTQIIRAALSKTLTRPRMDYMKPNNQVNFNFNYGNVSNPNPAGGPWSASAGNARLRPLKANQFDLAYDWYFADDGFVSFGFFYKDLVNWHADGSFIADFTPFYIPGYHQGVNPNDPNDIIPPATFEGIVTAKADGLKGFVRGYDIQGNIPFHIFSESLDGIGLIASAALYDGKFDDGTPIPGLSKESYQSTLYFEKGGFQARVSWTKRSSFATEEPGLSLALTPTTDQGAELIDAQIGYDFGLGGFDRLDGLYVSLQGLNLTNEDTLHTDSDARQVTKWQTFGANYLLNVIYRFK
jgi:iron complex outermembrane recepter protein